MSAFGIGTNTEAVQSGEVRGRQITIACKAWFTSGGSARPLSFKFEGDDGMLQTVHHVTVNYTEDKNYCGIPSKEYGCKAVIGGLMHEFKLIFYPDGCRWVMVLPETGTGNGTGTGSAAGRREQPGGSELKRIVTE